MGGVPGPFGAGVLAVPIPQRRDAFDATTAAIARGLVVAAFGLSGMLCGRAADDAVDRFGRVPVSMAGALGFAPGPAALAALWFAAGAASALVWAGINTALLPRAGSPLRSVG